MAARTWWQLSINVPSALGIGAVASLCALAAFLAYDAEVNVEQLGGEPAGTSLPMAEPVVPAIPETKVKEDWDELLGMSMRADLYRDDGLHGEAEREEELARQKIGEVAREYLGVEFVSSDTIFFMSKSSVEGRFPASCEPTGGEPAHLAEIRRSEWFGTFAGKYSQYGIKMAMSALYDGGTSYGFFAESGDGTRAITYFQTDSCTGQTAALNEHLLLCIDREGKYTFASSDRGDITASLGLEEFCFIPITDSWRQSVYDYSERLRDELRQLGGDPREAGDYYESKDELAREARSLVILSDASRMIATDIFEYEAIRKTVQKYCDEFGPLPEDYVALVERGAQDTRLATC